MGVDVSKISDTSGPETIESWNSFRGLVLVDSIETEFNVKFTLDEIIDVKTIIDIKRHLKNHDIVLDD